MGLTGSWRKAAASRGHVLVVEAPGAFRRRVALVRAVEATGWSSTGTVADADVLAVVGEPGADLMAVVDHTWEQMSEPRARVEVHDETEIPAALDRARRTLQATDEQRAGAHRRRTRQVPDHDEDQDDEHGDHEQGDHGHGDMSPDGIPLASGAEDRDGLEMDELHLPLGPVLSHWPPGLVLRLTLHGDVVSDAEAERLDPTAAPSAPEDGPTTAARLLDATASVLALAGLPVDGARAARLRDDCLAGSPIDDELLVGAIEELEDRVRRHRVLRWALQDLAVVGVDGARKELHDRLVGLLGRARVAIIGGPEAAAREHLALAALPHLVRGQELAAVRLWVAALGPDLVHDQAAEVV